MDIKITKMPNVEKQKGFTDHRAVCPFCGTRRCLSGIKRTEKSIIFNTYKVFAECKCKNCSAEWEFQTN